MNTSPMRKSTTLGLSLLAFAGMASCDSSALVSHESDAPPNVSSTQQAIVDVAHTAVERQSIGNCWIYAQATWI